MSAEHDDFERVCEDRGLAAHARERLDRALRGGGDDNRDLPAWMAAHVAAAVAALAGGAAAARADRTLALVFDGRTSSPRLLAGMVVGEDRLGDALARADAAGLHLRSTAAATDFSVHWRPAADALAFLHVLASADGCERLGTVRDALLVLADAAVGLQDRLAAATRLFGQVLYGYRTAHFPRAEFERRHRRLKAFFAERHGPARHRWSFGDRDILDFWLVCVAEGERLKYRTAVAHVAAYRQTLHEADDAAALGRAVDVDDPVLRDRHGADGAVLADVETGPRAPTSPLGAAATGGALVDQLARIPEEPKTLLAVERALLEGLFGIEPFHRTLPLTVLRLMAFGPVQDTLVEMTRSARTGTVADPDRALARATDYAAVRRRFADLAGHLTAVLRFALDLRREEAGDATGTARPPRRQGFDGDRASLRARIAEFDEDVATVRIELAAFLDGCDRLHAAAPVDGRYQEDLDMFTTAFRRIYGTEGVAR